MKSEDLESQVKTILGYIFGFDSTTTLDNDLLMKKLGEIFVNRVELETKLNLIKSQFSEGNFY